MDLSRLYHLLFSQYGPGLTGIFMRQRQTDMGPDPLGGFKEGEVHTISYSKGLFSILARYGISLHFPNISRQVAL
jgi:hypothetical protein